MSEENPGIDPALLLAGDFILLRTALVDALDGDYEAAILLQRIAWRCERTGEWEATHDVLAGETRLGIRKVRRALAVLKTKGFLTSRRADPWNPTQVWSVPLVSPDVSSRDDRNVQSRDDRIGNHVTDADVITRLPERTSLPIDSKRTSLSNPLDDEGALLERSADPASFDAFWSVYPRRQKKADARKAWAKATAAASPAVVLDAARVYAATRADQDPKYTALPASWLNGERWADEKPSTPPAVPAHYVNQNEGW